MSVPAIAHAAMKFSDLFYLFEDRGAVEKDGLPYRREVRRRRFSTAGETAVRAFVVLLLVAAALLTIRWFFATPAAPVAPPAAPAPERAWDAPGAP